VFNSIEVEKALGWRVFSIPSKEKEKILSENESRQIVALKNSKKVYLLRSIPELSVQEARMVRSILRSYQQNIANFDISQCLKSYCEQNFLRLDSDQQEYIKLILDSATKPAGILCNLLEDERLEEIALIGLGKSKPVYVFDCAFGWLSTNIYFSQSEEVKRLINSMASTIGRRITLQHPKIDAMLPDGSRLNACIEPISIKGPQITIRKFKKNPLTATQLMRSGSMSASQAAFLWMAMQSDCSILICGNTGSGKTTLLNSLFGFANQSERIVIVEDTPEINIPHAHTVCLASTEEIGVDSLVKNTLRMRPDRVVVGEMRTQSELGAFIDTLLAGQGKGSYATFHAQSASEAVLRAIGMGTNPQDLCSLDLIITQKRWSVNFARSSSEQRKLTQICEVEYEKERAMLRELFSYDFSSQKFVKNEPSKKVAQKICRAFKIELKELDLELEAREKFLLSLGELKMEEFLDAICTYQKNY